MRAANQATRTVPHGKVAREFRAHREGRAIGCCSRQFSENSGIQNVLRVEGSFDSTVYASVHSRRREIRPESGRQSLVEARALKRLVEHRAQIGIGLTLHLRQDYAYDAAPRIAMARRSRPALDESKRMA